MFKRAKKHFFSLTLPEREAYLWRHLYIDIWGALVCVAQLLFFVSMIIYDLRILLEGSMYFTVFGVVGLFLSLLIVLRRFQHEYFVTRMYFFDSLSDTEFQGIWCEAIGATGDVAPVLAVMQGVSDRGYVGATREGVEARFAKLRRGDYE